MSPHIDLQKYRREARQAETLSDLEKRSYQILNEDLVIASADTIIYEHYKDLATAKIWLSGLHWDWLGINMNLCRESGGSVYYRYIIVPYPYAEENPAKRKLLSDFIVFNVHLHLWHGVVCVIKFLDPKLHHVDRLAQEMNFFVVPKAREFYGLPAYYHPSKQFEQSLFTGSEYSERQNRVRKWALLPDSKLVWLFYDEAHFSSKRLSGWHWQQLREFYLHLYRRCQMCPLCRSRMANELDHIGPVSKGYFQTLSNFQLLCGACNRAKSNLEIISDPLAVQTFIEPNLFTKALERTFHEPPPWLGRIKRPTVGVRRLADNLALQ